MLTRNSISFDEQRLDNLFSNLDRCHSPGAAVGIAIAGRPIYRKGFGLASLELPVVLSPSIRMRIGSTSKQFVSFAYMLLCEDGNADPDDPIGRFLPNLHPATGKVTARQLMTNTSGIRDVFDIFHQFNEDHSRFGGPALSVTRTDLLRYYQTISDTEFEPSTEWRYNNGGWLLLTAAIEHLSEQPLEAFMKERIFGPIGMHDTHIRWQDDDFLLNSASQHASTKDGHFRKRYWGLDNYSGAGAMVSTVDDLLRWLDHMNSPKVGTIDTWNAMKRPAVLTNGFVADYGFGLVLNGRRGYLAISHSGNALGGNAQALTVPELRLSIVVLVNRQDQSSVDLADKVLTECVPSLKTSRRLYAGPFAQGTFQSSCGDLVLELFERSEQQVVALNGIEIPTEPDDGGKFWLESTPFPHAQAITPLGDPTNPKSVLFASFGAEHELTRVPRVLDNNAHHILGQYSNVEIGATAAILDGSNGPELRTFGSFGSVCYRMTRLTEHAWKASVTNDGILQFPGGVLVFDRDHKTFSYSTLTTRGLRFIRS